MMNDIPDRYRHDLLIIRETTEQILRDLNISDFKIIFSGNEKDTFDELKTQLIPVIEKLFKEDGSSFRQMLYRVDIDEKEYKKALSEKESAGFEEAISELIIRREFQKVLTRKYFSKK